MTETEAIHETIEHIRQVQKNIQEFCEALTGRGLVHDASKMHEPELSAFCEVVPKLKELTYGSDEYVAVLKDMQVALAHHYKNNRHHPEHSPQGVDGMNLVTLVEMYLDWLAACKRHSDGDIIDSIEINAKRFNLSPQLKQILLNTAYDDWM